MSTRIIMILFMLTGTISYIGATELQQLQVQTQTQASKPDPKMGTIGLKLDPHQQGITIIEIIPNSSGQKAGFKVGDKITLLNKNKVKDVQEFMAIRMNYKVGDVLEIGGTDANNKAFVRKVKIMPVS